MFNIETILFPITQKKHDLRKLTQLNSFTGLKSVNNNSNNNQKQINDANCSTQLVEPKNKENTRIKSQEKKP